MGLIPYDLSEEFFDAMIDSVPDQLWINMYDWMCAYAGASV